MIIRSGYKLSFNDEPSLKNSGENIIRLVECFVQTSFVKPTGTVDFIIMEALLKLKAFSITDSTEVVSK